MNAFWSYFLVGAVMFVGATVERLLLIAFHRNWFRQGYAGDGAFHYAVVHELQRTGRYAGVPHFLMRDDREPDTYPILFHRFAALFPAEILESRAYAPNLVLWIVLSTAAALYAQYVGAALFHIAGPIVGLVFTVFFLFSASNLSLESNGLNYISLSERLLARFCCAFCIAALTITMTFGDTFSLGIAIIAGAAAGVTSLFARQAILFVLPVTALVALDPRPLYVLAAAFVGAVLIDRSYFLRGLRHMALYLQSYNRVVKNSRFFKPALSRWLDWRVLFGLRTSLDARLGAIEGGEPTQLLVRVPEVALLAYVWWLNDHLIPAAVAVLIGIAVVYVLVTTPYLRHFGESIRYFEYDSWLLVPMLLAVHFARGMSLPIAAIVIYALWVGIFTWRRIGVWRRYPFPAKDQMRELVNRVGLKPEDTVYTVPLHLGAEVSARAWCRSFNYQGVAVTVDVYRRFVEEPPMLKRDWRSLAREHGVTHIVADKRHFQWIATVADWSYDFSGLPVLGESDFYIVYRVPAES